MAKKALAIISFGTSYPEARRSIETLEQTLAHAMPEYDFYRAFTSEMVIRKIAREEGIQILNPQNLMYQLRQQGYTEVVCQSLHVIPGMEYEKMCAQIQNAAGEMQVKIGQPMLTSQEDYIQTCQALLKQMPVLEEDEAFVYVGHGTEHAVNAAYSQVENTFRFLDAERVYVGTVEGFPGLDYVQKRLQAHKIRKVWIAPFLIVAGDHAQNDLAGTDADSWKSVLSAAGYTVEVSLRALGDIAGIGELFVKHCTQAAYLTDVKSPS